MRYYRFVIRANEELIKSGAKVDIGSCSYESPHNAMNNYIWQHIDNGRYFFTYREEGERTYAAFSYDEKKEAYADAYEGILEILRRDFSIKRVLSDPCEITMFKFMELIREGYRRQYSGCGSHRIAEATNLFIFSGWDCEPVKFNYKFDEKVVSDRAFSECALYDQSFIDELSNIKAHKNNAKYQGNPVHYVISSRSVEAAGEMTEALMQSLLESGRISSRRMEIISEIEPYVYREKNQLEQIIENNYGGVVIFDLTEKFGFDPTDYVMMAKYIEKLLKRYRNNCLFVFSYNMDHPGFSYMLLPKVKKYVIPVMLREGSGDRKAAVSYMKELIRSSEYKKYAGQAGEYMKLFPGDVFTQTDVLMAYEQFEPWCVNRNVLQAYNYDLSSEFMLDRDENATSSYDRLKKLIGLEKVKKQIDTIIASDIVEHERKKCKGKAYQSGTMHMIFGGNPGSAKTTVARLFAGIAKEKGILKSGAFVERGGMDLDGLGCVYSIRDAFLAAKGGVLFIDEAYSMCSDTAITVLIQEMENHRDDVIAILAGYNDRMREFMELNEGLKSRIPYWVDFPDYSTDELTEIFKLMMDERGFRATGQAVREARFIFEKVRTTDNFGNGRYVRNLLDKAAQNQAVRLLSDGKEAESLRKGELFLITKKDISGLEEGLREERAAGTAQKELDDMIGLSSVKEVIHKALANYKLNKLRMDKGISGGNASLHMVFTGNPGTAKTTVARLFAEILKDEKVLSTGNFVEVGRADLIGQAVGTTAPLVKRKFKEAQGGVLFIDEAYALCDGYSAGYGDEAINTLVQEMENHRDDVIVVFAGYPEPMKDFLDRNPGMLSRIAFRVQFEDYTTDELCDITKLMVQKNNMSITGKAMKKLRGHYDKVRTNSDYGNGRYVRKTLEEAQMNLAERLLKYSESEITTELLTTIDECDIPDPMQAEVTADKRIGF